MVAQGGIEPPTPGFSVLCSTYWATEPQFIKLAVWTGLEPAISSVTDWHVNQLHHQTIWLREKDLNQRPRGYEPRELPAALSRDISVIFTVLIYFTIFICKMQEYFFIFLNSFRYFLEANRLTIKLAYCFYRFFYFNVMLFSKIICHFNFFCS